ncbi:MAG: type II toxin-antitoxin system RelE/ParE family toxin [Actinomycetota bacterium]|nr:type II toxin-antitoxin system RelE/ParE family toxin [Actinomycetota bacterium]
MARAVLARSARRALLDLDDPLAEAVLDSVAVLERNPEAGAPLRGRLKGLWSLRVGTYRIIYEIREDGAAVRVVAIRHRAQAYRSDPC